MSERLEDAVEAICDALLERANVDHSYDVAEAIRKLSVGGDTPSPLEAIAMGLHSGGLGPSGKSLADQVGEVARAINRVASAIESLGGTASWPPAGNRMSEDELDAMDSDSLSVPLRSDK